MTDIEAYLDTVSANFRALCAEAGAVRAAADLCVDALKRGRKVIFCGNGGSAADSQHLAAELMGRFLKDRDPLPALALTVDTSALTAIGNDYGYDEVFARQLRGVAQAGDVLVGLSTSGRSKNVCRAFDVAKELGVSTVALVGADPGPMSENATLSVHVPSRQTNHIQEMHIAIGHVMCAIIEEELCPDRP